ncbi:hypothetical protein BH20ACT6_BH20ACT6_17570 [soil metagenome]
MDRPELEREIEQQVRVAHGNWARFAALPLSRRLLVVLGFAVGVLTPAGLFSWALAARSGDHTRCWSSAR